MHNHEKTTSENKWILGDDILLGHINNGDTITVCVHSCTDYKVGGRALLRNMPIEVPRILEVHIPTKQLLLPQREKAGEVEKIKLIRVERWSRQDWQDED